jgi:hypothetical protein
VKLTAAAGVALFIVTTYFMDDKRPPPGAEKDPYAGQPARGMFGGGPKPSGRYIPPDQWPRTADGRRIFQATHDWQEVPDDCVLPAGLHVEMNLQTSTLSARCRLASSLFLGDDNPSFSQLVSLPLEMHCPCFLL